MPVCWGHSVNLFLVYYLAKIRINGNFKGAIILNDYKLHKPRSLYFTNEIFKTVHIYPFFLKHDTPSTFSSYTFLSIPYLPDRNKNCLVCNGLLIGARHFKSNTFFPHTYVFKKMTKSSFKSYFICYSSTMLVSCFYRT